jgi:hypothetical protein
MAIWRGKLMINHWTFVGARVLWSQDQPNMEMGYDGMLFTKNLRVLHLGRPKHVPVSPTMSSEWSEASPKLFWPCNSNILLQEHSRTMNNWQQFTEAIWIHWSFCCGYRPSFGKSIVLVPVRGEAHLLEVSELKLPQENLKPDPGGVIYVVSSTTRKHRVFPTMWGPQDS